MSNGVLSADWVKGIISVKKDIDIMDVDIFEIKNKFKSFKQIEHVEVKRVFPDTIKINIAERHPVLLVLVQERINGNLIRSQMLVDSQGVVFYGVGYAKNMIDDLPYLDGAMIKKNKQFGQYECTDSIDRIAELMSMAKKKYPNIYSQFEVVSSDKIVGNRVVPWQRIKIKCGFAKEVIFGDTDFEEQLRKLNFVLSNPKIRDKLPVYRLDITVGKEVVVKFEDNRSGRY
jgi:hypothetical protein